jgi:light-regulated signal transduction histidine kinase (bacteriophytochrome)/CheY-like chemotaxis protein
VHLGRISEFYAHESIAFTACDTIFDLFREHFDRGMVYRFLDDASGEVIHEITSFDMKTSYLGLRFPASDIPLSARQLYIKNGLRYIHDVDTENVPVVSSSGDQDLTQVRMRGVAKPHILYLSNMGVKCSMSVAIVVNGDLWGLLVFHGYQKPFKPALHQRIACETICKMVSVRIEALAKKEQSQRIIELGQALMTMKYNRSILENMYELGEGILKVLDCEVVIAFKEALSYDAHNNFVVIGDNSLVPTEDFWKRLLSLARNREIVSISGRQSLSDAGISMKECPASGFAFFREGATHFFIGRKERSRDVVWAGKPDEPKLRIGGILTPRTSFETYMEKARVEARGWSSQDMNVLSVFRDRICDHCHNWTMSLLQNDIEQMNKKYMDAIDRAQQNYGFFARMSHELRTPFHGVMGCLDILDESIEEMPSNEAKSLVATAIASGNHMLNLLNDILDISKNKHLTHTQARERTVYQSLAFDTIDCMKSLATSKKIQLEFDILPTSDNNTIIATDRTKVIQIVSNIVNNAIKFTGKGRISVNFKLLESIQEGIDEWQKSASLYEGIAFTMKEGEMITSLEEVKKRVAHEVFYPDQRWMCVSVTDNGCGMNASELVDMFEPYTQGRGNRPKMGTGLGLFICVSLCLQLKGFLCCASSPGGGTIFQFGIPVDLETDELEDETITRPSSPSEHEPEPFIVMSGPIMVVDDNVVNVKLLKRTLERQLKLCNLDLEVLIATGGVAAVELYKEKRPSLCIVDYHMPEKDGVEVAKDIRKWEEEHDRQPSFILSYTADATEEAKYLILEQANDIMTKPPPKGYIQGLVRRLKVD